MKYTLAVLAFVVTACASDVAPIASPAKQAVAPRVDTVTSQSLADSAHALCSGYSVTAGECSVADAPSDSVSLIFAADPKRPGAGYVKISGVTYRIEGTSAAGSCDWCAPAAPKPYPAGLGIYYWLDDSKGHDLIKGPVLDQAHLQDLFNWEIGYHAPDQP